MKTHQLLFLCGWVCLSPHIDRKSGIAISICFFGMTVIDWVVGYADKKAR